MNHSKITNMFDKSLAGKCFNAILMFLVSTLFFSCSGTRTITDEDLLIELQRTACYGFCPVYTVKIDKNGKGLFEGVENVEKIGRFSFSLKKDELAELENTFLRIDFYQLRNIYDGLVSDLPTTYITYIRDGRRKKIMDYYGAPATLRSLENRIETLVLSKKMKKIK
ncbi:MAG: hypothetical protein AMS26_03445 [Bacteroides sp. SM23_62]|nr:MAG: hypothetical protein AMS26_03445 [Bacteroides sp. SM23_62]